MAFATRQRLVLGQIKVAGKSNEIVAIPALLDMLAVEGAVVTIDAMGCQREIARKSSTRRPIIPRSRQDPKILRIDDTEIVGDRIAEFGRRQRDTTRALEHYRVSKTTCTTIRSMTGLLPHSADPQSG
jgi:predicted transposase YbfD/YdcC